MRLTTPPAATAPASTSMLNLPLVSSDMKTLAPWTSTLPKTCLEASKNQILTGRCGRSRQRLYTSESRARAPRASCTKMANGPRRLHSVGFTGPAGEPVAVEAGGRRDAVVVVVVMMVGLGDVIATVTASTRLRMAGSAAEAWRWRTGGV
jgi:hypothetical protein